MKKTMKKILCSLLVILMCLTSAPLQGFVAADWSWLNFGMRASAFVETGQCGDNVYWNYDSATGELVISGTGAMYDYTTDGSPFTNLYIKKASIENGVTTIGRRTFEYNDSIEQISIADSVVAIGDLSFSCCDNLKNITIPKNVTCVYSSAFASCINLQNIYVDSNNAAYSNSENGVLFNKDKTSIVSYPAGKQEKNYSIPIGVNKIESFAFSGAKNIETINIPDTVISIDMYAFIGCNIKEINIPDSVKTMDFWCFASCNNLKNVVLGKGLKRVSSYSFIYCENLETITFYNNIKNINICAFSNCINLADVYFYGTEQEWNQIQIDEDNDEIFNATIHFLDEENIYNLGEETYSFANYGDSDSPNGHCFGMSVTSSGYHIGELDITSIIGSTERNLYSLGLNNQVKAPICHYQAIQGSSSLGATVAGGSYYKTRIANIESDWNEVINYVKDHKYDNKGTLQIGFRGSYTYRGKAEKGGHAINFIRYEEVNGQPRIYAYDNNFPNAETYFYEDSYGKIKQVPYATFDISVDCIALRDVNKYFDLAESFDESYVLYADENNIFIEDSMVYPMDIIDDANENFIYEIIDSQTQIIIEPLCDNATFTYMGVKYSFGEIKDDTYGIFTLSTTDDTSSIDKSNLQIFNDTDDCSCNCHKNGIAKFFFNFILFFQKLFKTNKTCSCGVAHY